MQPSVRQTLTLIRQEINAGLVEVPTPQEVSRMRNEDLNISQDSLAELAEVSPGIVEAIDRHGQASPAMLVWLQRVMQMATWSPRSQEWVRLTMDANGKQLRLSAPKRVKIGNGYFRHGLGRRALRRAEAREARRQAEETGEPQLAGGGTRTAPAPVAARFNAAKYGSPEEQEMFEDTAWRLYGQAG